MGKQSHFAYDKFRKFAVAPESIRAIVSALFIAEWMYNRKVIDFCPVIYTSLLLCLISANLIKLRENPRFAPFLWLAALYPPASLHPVLPSGMQSDLLSTWGRN